MDLFAMFLGVEVEVVVEVVAVEEGEEAVVLMQVHRLRLKN